MEAMRRGRRPPAASAPVRRCRGEAGATTELVLVTPVLMFAIFLIIQFALYFHASQVAGGAAADGLAVARVETGTAADGQARAEAILDSLASTLMTDRAVTASRTADTARVQVTGRSVSIVPGFSLAIKASAEGPVERFTVDGAP